MRAPARRVGSLPDTNSNGAPLIHLVADLEQRSNMKPGDDKGVVACGNGVYVGAKAALAAPKPPLPLKRFKLSRDWEAVLRVWGSSCQRHSGEERDDQKSDCCNAKCHPTVVGH